ncbi:MAG TPA: cytochrome c-type biogenesis CcmF C-terminal domain-containing protein [Vicinamibacterales bacterium]|jgi:cytochrome c-type biogenesis protein CcmF|nr:cytochrome c-type biogenesis CcmF C-terminal domain-containing protein [Vicinamibacterales bacterium]
MATLGTFLLLATFVVCTYAAAVSIAGARRRSRRLIESGIGAFYLVAALMTVASAVIINAFLTDDFSIRYVAHYSDSVQPLFYKITSYWGGLDGSIMFWVFLLSLFGSAAVYVNRERHRELIPYVVAVISIVQMFFLFVMVVHNNPFATFITTPPADGNGLTPALQNYWMVIHPPSLYTGFVGMTIPFAFGMAALITGYLDDSWLRAVRRWTMFAWLFLTLGLMLGMIWAYEELGWGGYWAWDPVENAALLPWFTATAFLHSVMVQERRSMLRVWNVTLVIVTFFLTIFGTFMTRSGVVSSVHAFGEDPKLAWMFTIFMVTILVVSFGFVIYRLPLLRARNTLDSWASREAAFLVNNWILLFCAFFILFATMFPTLSEAITGERITVGPPFFNKWMLPIGLTLLFLTGIGPLLAWRKSTVRNLAQQLLWPVVAAAATLVAMVAFGIRLWVSGICFALCAMVAATVAQEFVRGANVRRGNTGTDIFTALVGLVGRNKRRYGGYIVHLGVVLIFLGFAGQSFNLEEVVPLKPGQEVTIGRYTLRMDALKVAEDDQKQMVTAYITAFEDGKQVDTMYPAKWFYRKHESQPTTETAIRRRPNEDLYVVLAKPEIESQTAFLQVNVNPLVNWVWFGFGIIAIGTGIALLPERAFSFALAKAPAGAAATTAALLLAMVLFGAPAFAQSPRAEKVEVTNLKPLEKQMQGEILCMCGGCKSPLNDCPMLYCHMREPEKAALHDLVEQGKTRDQIVAAFIKQYGGQDVLGAPLDQGFNRLAWLFPYLVGAASAISVGLVAVRLSRRTQASADAEVRDQPDAGIEERLDDELRDLD